MLPPELSLRSPLPSPLAMNNSPPEGPMRFAKIVFLVNAGRAEASARAPSSRKNAVTVIPSFVMKYLPLSRASYAPPTLDTTNLPRERAPRDQGGSDGSFFPSDYPRSPCQVPGSRILGMCPWGLMRRMPTFRGSRLLG